MKKIVCGVLGVLGLVFGLEAQTSRRNLNINAQVNSRFKLETSATNVTFTRTVDPRTNPIIDQNEAPIQIRVKASRGDYERVYLRIRATGNLSDGQGHTIPAGNVTWTATGSGYTANGTLSTTAQQLGYWAPSGIYDGTIAFHFQDNQNFSPGVYTLTVTFSASPT